MRRNLKKKIKNGFDGGGCVVVEGGCVVVEGGCVGCVCDVVGQQ